jgi:hypothetical protein
LEDDEAFGDGLAAGDGLVADVDHPRLAGGGKMSEFRFRHAR